ncbi:MAG TPA: hypothetical protein VN228_08240 [Pyrinomonadaceae bacterium]|nr:hypothetical protein [Pyrinomonadaceae bacterium]
MQAAKSRSWFTRFAKWTARVSGQPATFALSVLVIAAWALTQLDRIREGYERLAKKARAGLEGGLDDTDAPDIGRDGEAG